MSHGSGCEFASKVQATRHHFHNFYVPTHFRIMFFKKVLLAVVGSTFSKNNFKHFRSISSLVSPQAASKIPFVPILFTLFALLAVPIPIFSLFEPFGILIFAHHLCIFSLRSPVSKNDRMHHTNMFVNFVAIDASLHHTCKLHDLIFICLMLQLTFRLTDFEPMSS